MVLSQLQKSHLEPEYSRCEEYRATPTTNLYPKVVPRWNGIISEMQHYVSKYDVCILCGGDWRHIPLKTQHGQNMQVSKALNFFNFAISNRCCRKNLSLYQCREETQHFVLYSVRLSTCILTFLSSMAIGYLDDNIIPYHKRSWRLCLVGPDYPFISSGKQSSTPNCNKLSKICAVSAPESAKGRVLFAKRRSMRFGNPSVRSIAAPGLHLSSHAKLGSQHIFVLHPV